eukprot:762630-Hanusia_phi.AAC.4
MLLDNHRASLLLEYVLSRPDVGTPSSSAPASATDSKCQCLGWMTDEQVEYRMIHTKSMVFLNSSASQEGIFWLFVCILGMRIDACVLRQTYWTAGGLFYEQAPKKPAAGDEDANGEVGEVKEALLEVEGRSVQS